MIPNTSETATRTIFLMRASKDPAATLVEWSLAVERQFTLELKTENGFEAGFPHLLNFDWVYGGNNAVSARPIITFNHPIGSIQD